MFALPTKDIIYGVILLLVIAGFGVFTVHERNIGKAHELAVLQESSQKLQAQADAKVAAIASQHATEVSTIKVNYENQHAADSLQHDSDAQRLRNFDAYRSRHEAMGRAATGPGAAGAVGSGDSGSFQRDSELEQVALQLATAARDASNSLKSCIADRSALTGK